MASISTQLGLPQIYKDVKTKSIERTLLPLVKQVSKIKVIGNSTIGKWTIFQLNT